MIVKFCVEIAELGIVTIISATGDGLVIKTAVEHGSSIMMSKLAVTVIPSTVAVRVNGYELWCEMVAPLIWIFPAAYVTP